MTTTETRPGPGDEPATIEAVARRLYSEVWNEGRYEVAAELIHPDFTYAARPDLRGPAAKLAAIRMHRATFPDSRFTVEELIVVPGRVAVRTAVTGTDTGGLAGRSPSGRVVTGWSVEFLGFRDGLIVSDWVGADWSGCLGQSGSSVAALPSAPPRCSMAASQVRPTRHPGADGCGRRPLDPLIRPGRLDSESIRSSGRKMLVSVEENRALVWQAYDTTFNRHDPEAARSCYAAGYVGHMPHHPQPVGRDDLIAESNEIVAALPDVTVTFDDAFGVDDRLVVRHSFVGTHTGPLMGIPPTGRRLTFSGTDVYRIVDGEIVEEWSQPDLFGVLNQLGVIPASAP